MATDPTQLPDGGGLMQGAPGGPKQSGTATGIDPTLEPGNYAPSLFGVNLPQGTGAPGSGGAYGMATDPTNEPGQTSEGFSGLGPQQIAQTGAPGSGGATVPAGGTAVTYTEPGSFLSGTNKQATASVDLSTGTEANNAYGSGGNMPGVQGNTPTSTGAGAGRVMRGGRSEG